MKNIKLMIILFGGIFLMTACLASSNKTGSQIGVGDQERWQTYTNEIYQFTVQFPSVWRVIEPPTPEYPTVTDQVWFVSETLPQPQSDSRADIVFIFTQQDPSSDWDPKYFDDYQSDTFQLGDIQAWKISGINKESRFSEIVVLAKIGDYYLQALPNHGEVSLTYFDQVVSSLRFDRAEAQATPSSTKNGPENLAEQTIAFKGISFTFPTSVAEGAVAQQNPAFVDPSGFMYDDHPDHIRFDFVNPYTMSEPFASFQPIWAPWLNHQNPESSEIRPQIFIFPTKEYAEISPLAWERIETLKNLLNDNAFPAEDELPVLPTFNSAQDFSGHVASLEFQGGRGLRFIARYSQEASPVVNPSIFYTFQGLTDDGSLYVAAFFPLYVPTLPNQIQVEDWDTFNRGYQDYMVDLTSKLEALASNDFEPHLEMLDALIRSMIVSNRLTSSSTGTNATDRLDEKTIAFEGISFSYPSSLADDATAENIPAAIDPSGFQYYDLSEHVRFDFSNPYTKREPFASFQPIWAPWLNHQNPEISEIRPQIFIFPTTEYAEISPLAGERIETLKNLLVDNALPIEGELPVLPTFNSAQDLRGQVKPLAFLGGRGLRFIARYSQEAAPVVNPAVFYTFQGLTEDGSLYVAAFFPLYVPILPDQIQVEDWDAFNRGYQDYMVDIASRLEMLESDDFEPDLVTFDNLIRSMSISPTPGSATLTDTPSASTMPTPEPPCFVTGFSPIAFMPDGDRILVKAENGVQIFNLQTMEDEEFLEAPAGLIMPAVAVSPDGEVLAWALEDFSIQLIRISDEELLHTLTGHTGIIGKLIFSPDGDRLFSASHDTWVRVWDMEGNLVHAFQPTGALGFPDEVLGIGISPDGMMLATIPFDGPVKLWNLKDYQLTRELGANGGFDTSDIAFSPEGQLVASDTATGLFMWKTSDGTELLSGNPGINSLAVVFSPDGRFLAYGDIGEKFDVVVSSPDGAQKIRTLEGHPGPVGILFFSPDSSLLLSSDWIETRIWQVEDGQLLYVGKSSCP